MSQFPTTELKFWTAVFERALKRFVIFSQFIGKLKQTKNATLYGLMRFLHLFCLDLGRFHFRNRAAQIRFKVNQAVSRFPTWQIAIPHLANRHSPQVGNSPQAKNPCSRVTKLEHNTAYILQTTDKEH